MVYGFVGTRELTQEFSDVLPGPVLHEINTELVIYRSTIYYVSLG
jgi:hypothetical protein